jgi:predicted transcriptional regulator
MKLLVPVSALALRAVILKTSVPDLHIVKIEPGANVHSMARHISIIV